MTIETATIDEYTADFITETNIETKRVSNLNKEENILRRFLNDLGQDDVVYDIGANIGIYSIFACKNVDSSNVYAFEPHKNNVKRLKENAVLNGYGISVNEIALFDIDDTLYLEKRRDDEGEGKAHISYNKTDTEIVTVRGDSLNIQPPDVIKLDVEGAEVRVLKGMGKLLDNCRLIYIEAHPNKMNQWYNDEIKDMAKILAQHELGLKKIQNRGAEIFYRVEKI